MWEERDSEIKSLTGKPRWLRGQLFNKRVWDVGGILENQFKLQGRQGQKASIEHFHICCLSLKDYSYYFQFP